MARDAIESAKLFMRRRQFDKAINVLEGRARYYEENSLYYVLLGTAYLYAGDTGSATVNYSAARRLSLTDSNLLLGQAAIFLRRGDTDRAVNYYIEILNNDPSNKTALRAMEFIRTRGDFTTICRWTDNGKIESFYPPLGMNPSKILAFIFPLLACIMGCFLAVKMVDFNSPGRGNRADLSDLMLTLEERASSQETDLSSGAYNYLLTSKEIASSYDKAQRYFQDYRDNLSQIEINRILNSNASVQIKTKARTLMGYLEEPSFDTIKDSPSFQQVEKETPLYLDCWVSWSGRISNVNSASGSYSCDFLVGYESMERVDGIVRLRFAVPPDIVLEKPVTVLARISSEGGKLLLEGRSVYQSVKNNVINNISTNENILP